MNMGEPESSGAFARVRVAVISDAPSIRGLAVDNGMFAPDDLADFDELLRGYVNGSLDQRHWIVAHDEMAGIVGAAYYAPEPFADRVWNLYFLAVHPGQHRLGIGSLLLSQVERSLRGAGEQAARVLIVETSSTITYQGARRFYDREGFDREARVRDFYGPGDAKIVFWKSLVPARQARPADRRQGCQGTGQAG